MQNANPLVQEFLTKEKKNKAKKKRAYLHFDNRIQLTSQLLAHITSPDKIVRHSFYPFLHIDLMERRYKQKEQHTVDKVRSIFYASHLDSLIYSWYALVLNKKYEEYIAAQGIETCVLAYRKIKYGDGSKCNIHFAKEVFDFIEKQKECVAIALDISKFFDTIDHAMLKAAWQQILQISQLPEDHYKIFRSLTKYAFVERNEAYKALQINLNREKDRKTLRRICDPENFRSKIREAGLVKQYQEICGIPQGSPLSALLSNIYLVNFDDTIFKFVSGIKGLYCRYSDDMIVVCSPDHAEKVIKMMTEEIEKYKLKINADKTERVYFEPDGSGNLAINREKSSKGLLQYLGFEFNGSSMYIRSASMSRYYRKMKRRVRKLERLAKKYHYKGQIFKRTVYEQNTHLGKQNFISYAKHAADITDSEAIKKQIKPHWKNVQKELAKIKV